ncbi:uncharacterized protein MELLADRAFT_101362 [Melampsora larici-populina 98AG31]|uniref:Uncharacterized protein n=1 Tax=Melampsora larici-populina (strain 98AG31 / pathotype 3-4-7) TaxID=747676 RepID=F4R4H7_MELLP|nr:uncharacterized protein MELLADRAFT_101362 [Melampsora larici-populina 98AG31]EGG13000.1 hypothetical protein MELLADRAFT_101362 [Melampsora larici-populina 98AG31]
MPEENEEIPPASIRPYEHEKDFKFIRYLIGASILSRTGPANIHLFWSNPLIYIWVIISTTYIPIKRMLLSDEEFGKDEFKEMVIEILMKLPVFVGPPLILLVLLNWCHRRYFNSIMKEVISREDMKNPKSYYNGQTFQGKGIGESSIWVLDYDDRQIGVVAIEKSLDLVNEIKLKDGSNLKNQEENKEDLKAKFDDFHLIRIRHLATSVPFRPAGIDLELLNFSVTKSFKEDLKTERIMINLIPILDQVQIEAIEAIGFIKSISTQFNSKPFWNRIWLFFRSNIGWPDCKEVWNEEVWVLERSRFDSKVD